MNLSTAHFRVALCTLIMCAFAAGALCAANEPQEWSICVLPFTHPPKSEHLSGFIDHVNASLPGRLTTPRQGTRVVSLSADPAGPLSPQTDERAASIGARAGCDFLIFGSVEQVEQRVRLKAVMWEVKQNRAVVSTEHTVQNIHELPGVFNLFVRAVNKRLYGSPNLPFYKAAPSDASSGNPARPVAIAPPTKATGPWISPPIDSVLFGVDIGDIDGDHKNEMVFLESGGITICRFENGGLHQLTQYSQFDAAHFFVEVEDLDGDGVAELILCYQTAAGIESCILTYRDHVLKVPARIPDVALRAVKIPVNGKFTPALVGQRLDQDGFSGEMTRYTFNGSELTPVGPITLPKGTLLMSYDSGVIGDSTDPVQVIIDQDLRLRVFDKDNNLIASETNKLFGSERKLRLPQPNGGFREITLPGRVLIADTNGESRNELLVIRNTDGGAIIQAHTCENDRVIEKWRTIKNPGLITDFRIRDFKNEGKASLVLLLVKPNILAFMTPQSVIFAYDVMP